MPQLTDAQGRAGRWGMVVRGLVLGSVLLVLVRLLLVDRHQLSWLILGLQGMLLSLLSLGGPPAVRRMRVYPLLVAGAVYLWDAALPPPTLPAGVLRELLVRLMLVGIVAHICAPWVAHGMARWLRIVPAPPTLRIDHAPRRPEPRARPRRWLLDLILALFIGGLVLVEAQSFPPETHQVAQLTVCAGGSAMMVVWVLGERRALDAEANARRARAAPTPQRTAVQDHFLTVQRRAASRRAAGLEDTPAERDPHDAPSDDSAPPADGEPGAV
ncbi:MAG TPA: hypothetical protein VGE07_25960 [Herpetosiphonaceae bacterium]